MKLFWKIFLSIISIVTIIFSMFGGLLLKMSFDNALDGEISQGQNENQMFLYAFETSIEMLPDKSDKKDSDIEEIVEAIKKSIGQNQFYVRIYDKSGEIVYQDNSMENHITIKNIKEGSSSYTISEENKKHYLEIMSKMEDSEDIYYIDLVRNIQHVYDDSEKMLSQYQWVLLVMLIATGFLSYILSRKISKPITGLSDIVCKMAMGDYTIRADIKTTGEVGTLVDNFNIMAKKLEENILELEDAARKQEDFTVSFAHELKTPLTSIVGYSDMIRSMNLDEKEIKEYSNYIFMQGKRLEKLSYSLMDLISLDKQEISFIKINVNKMFQGIQKSILPVLSEKRVKLVMEIEEGYIQGNENLLYSLFLNLMDNARKAINENGIIAIKGKNVSGGYNIFVQDNGCGMKREEIKKITEAFYMIDKSRARKEGGAGIGMSLCKKIIKIHSAQWSIKSKPGKGTIISVFFPDINVDLRNEDENKE